MRSTAQRRTGIWCRQIYGQDDRNQLVEGSPLPHTYQPAWPPYRGGHRALPELGKISPYFRGFARGVWWALRCGDARIWRMTRFPAHILPTLKTDLLLRLGSGGVEAHKRVYRLPVQPFRGGRFGCPCPPGAHLLFNPVAPRSIRRPGFPPAPHWPAGAPFPSGAIAAGRRVRRSARLRHRDNWPRP